MSKKTAPKQKNTYVIPPLLLALIFLQCVSTLYVVLRQQTEIEHAAFMEKIRIMKTSHPQVYCPNPKMSKEKMSIDKAE
jgi:hypothetical protein